MVWLMTVLTMLNVAAVLTLQVTCVLSRDMLVLPMLLSNRKTTTTMSTSSLHPHLKPAWSNDDSEGFDMSWKEIR